MLTYFFYSQHPRVKNLQKGLPSGRIGSTYQKQTKKQGNNNNNNNNNSNKNKSKIITKIVRVIR